MHCFAGGGGGANVVKTALTALIWVCILGLCPPLKLTIIAITVDLL